MTARQNRRAGPAITAAELRRAWRSGQEIALLDSREEGPYSKGHPLWAVCLPPGRIPLLVRTLIPRFDTSVVVYDEGDGRADAAAAVLASLGYEDVRILAGGLAAYAAEGELYRDVNVPNKAFGELVEAIRRTPSLSGSEIKALQDAGDDMVILDSRRFEEYRTMSLPGATSVPGGELVLRLHDLAPSPSTLVVVNCAGRTRSIIGTQSLVNAGIPNRVVALRNGTIGWTLDGLSLETGAQRRFPELSAEACGLAEIRAKAWAERVGVKVIDSATLERWRHDGRTLYLFDVRTPEEYAAGHPEGFLSAPGGQLVQATDEWVAVRGARLVLFDDDGVRARMTASWLVQMGWEAVALAGNAVAADVTGTPTPLLPPLPAVELISPQELSRLENVSIVDLSPSPAYARAHIPGARFALPTTLASDLAGLGDTLVLTSIDGVQARFSAADAGRPVRILDGGNAAWAAQGLPLTAEAPHWLTRPTDVYKRPYEGTDNARSAMHAYIDWELQLVAQLANDGVANFHVVRADQLQG